MIRTLRAPLLFRSHPALTRVYRKSNHSFADRRIMPNYRKCATPRALTPLPFPKTCTAMRFPEESKFARKSAYTPASSLIVHPLSRDFSNGLTPFPMSVTRTMCRWGCRLSGTRCALERPPAARGLLYRANHVGMGNFILAVARDMLTSEGFAHLTSRETPYIVNDFPLALLNRCLRADVLRLPPDFAQSA